MLTSTGGSDKKYSVFAITVKHNLRRVADIFQREYIPFMAHFKIPHGVARFSHFEDLGWLPNEDDRYDLRAGHEARPAVFK
jgi:hypothetical protein